MSRRPRRNHTPAFKAKVALAAIKGDRTLAQLAEHFDVPPIRLRRGKHNSKVGHLTFSDRGARRRVRPSSM
jgi:transposase-like protein